MIPTVLMLPKRPALGVKLCPCCGKQFNVRGYGMHQKACKEPDGPIPIIDPEPGKDGTSCKFKSQWPYLNTPATDDLIQVVGISDNPHTEGVQESEESDEASGSGKCGLNCAADWCAHPRDVLIGSDTQTLRDGDIVIEYHPHSEKSTRILSPNEFKESLYHCPDPTVCQECSKNSTLFAQFLLTSLTYVLLSYFVRLPCANFHAPSPFLSYPYDLQNMKSRYSHPFGAGEDL